MSDEVKLKINVPMFEVGELEMFDNHIHDIVEEYSKMLFKEKDQILTQRIIIKQEQEIEELQNKLQQKENIIKEVREYIEDKWEMELKDSMEDFLDHDDLVDRKRLLHILEILDKVGDEK